MTAPDRMPSRRALQPPLPADLAALVAAGHLIEVEPGCFRRAPRTTGTTTAPTVRELHDHCISRIADALLAGDTPTARTFHTAARALRTSVGTGVGTPDRW